VAASAARVIYYGLKGSRSKVKALALRDSWLLRKAAARGCAK
jgi:hypothetical protein